MSEAKSTSVESGVTARDVLVRGREMMLTGEGLGKPCGRGRWCPYCAAADAKGLLAKATSEEMLDAARMAFVGGPPTKLPTDQPLIEAKQAIHDADPTKGVGPYYKSLSEMIFRNALGEGLS